MSVCVGVRKPCFAFSYPQVLGPRYSLGLVETELFKHFVVDVYSMKIFFFLKLKGVCLFKR